MSWGDIYFMVVLWIIKPHLKKSISNFFPKIGRCARTKKNRLKIRRHKQKVKTENPDFVQNGFIKVGIVCEISVKNSIDKKSCRMSGSPKQNQRGKKHIVCILSCKKNPCKKSTARIERVFFIDNKTKVRCY